MSHASPCARQLVAVAFAWVLAAACHNGTEPNANGTYSATVTGVVNASFSGTATFVVNATELGLGMTPSGDGWVLGFFALPRVRPDAGATFEIVPNTSSRPIAPNAYVTATEFFVGGNRFWTSTSGELRITASSPDRLGGTFHFTAQSSGAGSIPGEVTITGTFEAVCRGVFVSC